MTLMVIIRRLCDGLGILFLGALTLVSVSSIAGRYLFSMPVPDNYDLTRMMHGVIIALGVVLATRHRSHIQVDLLTRNLSFRLRKWVDLVTDSFVALIIGLLTWRVGTGMMRHFDNHEITMMLELPLWPLTALITVGFAVTCLEAARNVLQSALAALSADEAAK